MTGQWLALIPLGLAIAFIALIVLIGRDKL